MYMHIPNKIQSDIYLSYESELTLKRLLSLLYFFETSRILSASTWARIKKEREMCSTSIYTQPLLTFHLFSQKKWSLGVKWCWGDSPPQALFLSFPPWVSEPGIFPFACSPFCRPLMTDIFLFSLSVASFSLAFSPPRLIFGAVLLLVIFLTLNGSRRVGCGRGVADVKRCRKKRVAESRGKNPQVEKGGTYSEIERLGRNVTRWGGGEWEKKWIYLRDGLLLLNAPLCHHPLPSSSPLLPLPPPQGSRRRYEKVIMFPLEMACSPSTPFISKWNNLSTVACLFFSLHLHLSFQYTTHTPAVSFPFLSVFFSLPTAAFHLFNPSLAPPFFFFFSVVLSIVGALCCRYMPYQSVQLGMVLLPHSSAITLSS